MSDEICNKLALIVDAIDNKRYRYMLQGGVISAVLVVLMIFGYKYMSRTGKLVWEGFSSTEKGVGEREGGNEGYIQLETTILE